MRVPGVDRNDQGAEQSLLQDPHLQAGLTVCNGKVTEEPVAAAFGHEYVTSVDALRDS